MAGIRFDGVGKAYGAVEVIRDFTLDIADREFMVFVGPSGCGKSTALRMIAGLEEPSAGDLHIGDRRVNGVAPKARDVAMVFQSYALYPHMTVAENIAFGLKIRKAPKAEIAARVAEAAKILDLTDLLDRRPKALSGGQRQRVALGRALVRQPSVFLFDEPLSNLDAELRHAMRAEISRLQRRLETTAVYVTHDQVEAMTMGDRIAVLSPLGRAGRNLMQVGAPMELYARPCNVFVARFIGSPAMSVFEAPVVDGAVRLGEARLPVAERWALEGRDRVLAGLRAEDVRRRPAPGAQAPVPVSATVELVEPLGAEVDLHLSVAGVPLRGRTPAELDLPRPGDVVEVFIDAGRLHLFDAVSEQRLPERG